MVITNKHTVTVITSRRPWRRHGATKMRDERHSAVASIVTRQRPPRIVLWPSPPPLLFLLFVAAHLPNCDAFLLPIRIRTAVSFGGPSTPSAHDYGNEKGDDHYGTKPGRLPLRSYQPTAAGRRIRTIPLHARTDGEEDKEDPSPQTLPELFPTADFLLLREDATLASCYALCRFLIYDVTTGSKAVPGWQIGDFVALGGAFSSCIVLSGLWAAVGLSVGTFDGAGEDGGWKILLTAAVVGPAWLAVEIACGWPPGGAVVVGGLDGAFGVGNGSSIGVLYTIATGSVGLGAVLWFGRRWGSRL